VQTSRVQLALNVTDLAAAIRFYSELFGVEPAKQRAGYANFAIRRPVCCVVEYARRSRR
jgi:catechol 2,3-dioxygenase-like lactoylglutathione lyase family enzyme